MSESFAELFAESINNINIKPGSIINGVVIDISKDTVIVNAGLKSEGIIPISQFKTDKSQLEVEIWRYG